MIVNEESLGFGLFVGQKKLFEDFIFELWEIVMSIFQFFFDIL